MANPQLIGRLALRNETEVVAARLGVRQAAERLGLDRQDQTRIATAVSEIARNAFVYGGGGEIELWVDLNPRAPLFTLRVTDKGPGLPDLDAILAGQKLFPAGYGNGIVSARRLVDEFEIHSGPQGTQVRLSQRMPRAVLATLDSAALTALARALPQPRTADASAAAALGSMREQNRELIDSLTDLRARQTEAERLNRELEETNRGVVALYSELEERAEQLRTVSEQKSRFLSHLSHEFRTPLNSILALTRLLGDRVDGPLSAEQTRQVDYIRRSAQGLLEMVNDLLDLAKVEAGKLTVKPTLFTVEDLFTGLRGALKPLQQNAAVELVFADATGLPPVFADEPKLSQVLRNFVSNALKFTEAGQVRVAAHVQPGEERIVFEVRDTGIGIAPENLQVIFEEFEQIEGALQRGGTGLGLPLCKRLATLMGGEVEVESAPGRGSCFRLSLPLHFGQARALPEAGDAKPVQRVLVIDDEEAFRYIVRHIAQDAGCVVSEASDGRSGLAQIEAERPDLVVLDLQMPVLDGFGVIATLSESPQSQIPVIVCTSMALSLEQKRALAGAHAIVPKHDISRDGLTALLRSVLPQLNEVDA